MLKFNVIKRNRNAQVAETMTWVVATMIIIFLIVSSLYIASLLGKDKTLNPGKYESSEDSNWIEMKTEFALDVNNHNNEIILSWVEGSSFIDSSSGGEDGP
jgi:hypothetical protein